MTGLHNGSQELLHGVGKFVHPVLGQGIERVPESGLPEYLESGPAHPAKHIKLDTILGACIDALHDSVSCLGAPVSVLDHRATREAYLVDDLEEQGRHLTKVFRREDRVEHLPLTLVLVA